MLCVLCCLGQSPTGEKKESKLKDAMSQSSDKRKERDVWAGNHDSAMGLRKEKNRKEKRKGKTKKRQSPQREGMQLV